MSRLLRSFLGACLGAFMAIWPAATLNMAILVLPGALLGWLAGYHGDRLFGGLGRGWRNARRVGFKAYMIDLKQRSLIVRAICATGRGLGIAISATFAFIGFVIGSIPSVLSAIPGGIAATASAVGGIPATVRASHAEHPMNRAATYRRLAGFAGFLVILGFFWWLLDGNVGEPGQVVTRTGGEREVLTYGDVLGNQIMGTLFAGGILGGIAALTYKAEPATLGGFYGVWERYSNHSTGIFFLGEMLRYLYCAVWLVAVVAVQLPYILIGGMLTMLVGMMMVVPAYFGTIYGLRASWRLVRWNRDYGVVSLATGLLVGAITFFSLRAELVANPLYRLTVSAVAGVGAGAISMGITALCGLAFGLSITLRRMALQKRFLSDPLDAFVEDELFEKVVLLPLRLLKLLLPLNIRTGAAVAYAAD